MTNMIVSGFWVDEELPPIAELCIRSFLDNGISFQLFAYKRYANTPDGTICRNAAEILSESEVAVRADGSSVPAADLFRYTLLYKEGGFWTDMDVVCLKPELPNELPWFAFERPGVASVAFLGFPARHPAIAALREKAENPCDMAPWDSGGEVYDKESLSNLATEMNDPWGKGLKASTGAALFTEALNHFGLLNKCAASETIYPVPWSTWRWSLDGTLKLDDTRFKNSWAVCVWAEMVRRESDAIDNISSESIVWKLMEKHMPPPESATSLLCCGKQKKQTQIIVGICTSRKYSERRNAVRETWLSLPTESVTSLFFLGEGLEPVEESDDIVSLPVHDGYDELPGKILAFFRYALKHFDFEWLFKCDDDTYLAQDRLLSLIDKEYGLIGDVLVASRGAPSGGAGYMLSRETVKKIVETKVIRLTGPEDVIFGELAIKLGAKALSTARLCYDYSRSPRRTNDVVSSHWCSPQKLRELHFYYTTDPEAVFAARHPAWKDEISFYKNGVFIRSTSGCSGTWSETPEGVLSLHWAGWPVESLNKDGTGYKDSRGFILIPIPDHVATQGKPATLDSISCRILPHSNKHHSITAWGGIGNCVNAACAAQVSGRPLHWSPTGPLHPEDIFENPEILTLTDRGGDIVWLFPNIDPRLLGSETHHPSHESVPERELTSGHWMGRIIKGDHSLKLRVKPGGMRLPKNSIGVHFRGRHPSIPCDVIAAVSSINRLTETGTVFLASDMILPGLSSHVITGMRPKPSGDSDRSRESILCALFDWHTLGNCGIIYRNSTISTFADYWCLSMRIPTRKLIT